ncbi:hypothetical protein AAES_47601 [Amazona aestiva]|uniref:Uncharacterized protein n=1 Tax=Amazona aestiva TaxID=12930 RepID=A0A0Q3MQ77_AMAAE|nr:hypothetical protein AAES_47601 [Amazona aestiva]
MVKISADLTGGRPAETDPMVAAVKERCASAEPWGSIKDPLQLASGSRGGMGATLTKEEVAVLNLLQHILSKRGIRYEEDTLRGLLKWSKDKGLLYGVGTALELSTWVAIGVQLWDTVSDGGKAGKEAQKCSTLWKLIRETLRTMKSERAAVASAASALSPSIPQRGNEPLVLPAVAAANPFEHRLAAPGPQKLAKTIKGAFHNPPQEKGKNERGIKTLSELSVVTLKKNRLASRTQIAASQGNLFIPPSRSLNPPIELLSQPPRGGKLPESPRRTIRQKYCYRK